MCDDAAIFPPGLAPLADAVPAHLRHEASDYADLVGPLIVGVGVLGELKKLVGDVPAGGLNLTVTVPAPVQIDDVVNALEETPALRLRGLEVAIPDSMSAAEVVPAVDAAVARDHVEGVPVFVEVPRDGRRAELLEHLAGSPYQAKFRTGGIKAELYPDEAELAAAIADTVRLGLPFKATAGLHHAIRNTDPETGFEQHGFLNIALAVDAAQQGADTDRIVEILGMRDGNQVAAELKALPEDRIAAVRRQFMSFGTCSITDPLTELTDLGLIGAGAE